MHNEKNGGVTLCAPDEGLQARCGCHQLSEEQLPNFLAHGHIRHCMRL